MKNVLIKIYILFSLAASFTNGFIKNYKVELPVEDNNTTTEVPSTNGSNSSSSQKGNTNKGTSSNNNNNKSNKTEAKSENKDILSTMTLDEKIAQMLIIKFDSNYMSDNLAKELKYKPGGVILFASNITNYDKTTKLIKDIKATSSIPMFISVDQEGGRVRRITNKTYSKVTYIPSMRNLGYMNDANLAYDVGTVIAEELRAFGFNMDFAPVLDVVENTEGNVIGDRSLSNDPNIVGKLGTSLKKGLEAKGVISVYKHFPGHGATITDSHYELPVLTQTKGELLIRDLVPFQMSINDGASMIMIGHLAVPNITGDKTPASLSKKIITDLLKKEMNYNGLVITDSLQMNAITDNYSEKEIYEMAINAGVDILLMPNCAESAIRYIKQSIKEGKITEEQINNSVRKILNLKNTKLSTSTLSKDYIGTSKHIEIMSRIKTSG